MSLPPTYKPSPLSYGSPRTSPFRRPESPASPFRRPESPSSPSTTLRPTTPTPLPSPTKDPQSPYTSPTKSIHTAPLTSPSKLQTTTTTTPTSETTTSWTPRGLTPSLAPSTNSPQTSPTRSSSVATAIAFPQPSTTTTNTSRSNLPNNDAISRIPPARVREMREGFQILDRDNDGLVTRNDVVDMLTNLGQPSSASDVTPFFPPGAPQTLPLPTFLSTLSSLLAPLSQQTELLNAFAAFDDHDSGEIDVGELRDALLNTAPEVGETGISAREVDEVLGGFGGRRTFGKENLGGKFGGGGSGGGGRGEVFRYREWVGGVMGTGEEKKEGEKV